MSLRNSKDPKRGRSFKRKAEEDFKQSMNELRLNFNKYLGMIYVNETRKEGVLGCHRLI